MLPSCFSGDKKFIPADQEQHTTTTKSSSFSLSWIRTCQHRIIGENDLKRVEMSFNLVLSFHAEPRIKWIYDNIISFLNRNKNCTDFTTQQI